MFTCIPCCRFVFIFSLFSRLCCFLCYFVHLLLFEQYPHCLPLVLPLYSFTSFYIVLHRFTSVYIVLHRFYHVCNPLFPMFPSFDYTVFHYYVSISRVHLSAILLRASSTVQIFPSVVTYLVLQLNRIQAKSYSVQVQIYADRRANHCLFLHSAF